MTDWDPATERRRNFRIEETARLEFKPIEPVQQEDLSAVFPNHPEFDLLADLRRIDLETESLLGKVHETDKSIAACLRLLSKKIDRLAQALPGSDPGTPCPITISEGGFSFVSQQCLHPGQLLAIQLQLLPENTAIRCTATVIYSCSNESYPDSGHPQGYRVGCAFATLDDHQRDLVARHLIESQARVRRQLKNTGNQ